MRWSLPSFGRLRRPGCRLGHCLRWLRCRPLRGRFRPLRRRPRPCGPTCRPERLLLPAASRLLRRRLRLACPRCRPERPRPLRGRPRRPPCPLRLLCRRLRLGGPTFRPGPRPRRSASSGALAGSACLLPAARLAARTGAAGCPAVLVGGRLIRIRSAAAVLGVVTPVPVRVHVPVDVRVPVEVVVDVDVDVVVAPAAAPAPAAVPPRRPDRDANTERDHASRDNGARRRRGRIVDRRVRVDRRAIDDDRVVDGDVDDLGARRLDDNDRLLLDDLRLDLLLLVRLERAGPFGLLAHPLDGVHDVALLLQERVAEFGGPLDVVAKTLDDVGQRGHRLDAWIPRLFRDLVSQRLVLQARILREPLLELDDLERVGGRDEDLAEERVRIEGDGRHEGVELLGRKLRLFRRGLRRLGGRSLGKKHRFAGRQQCDADDRDKAPAGPVRETRLAGDSCHGAAAPQEWASATAFGTSRQMVDHNMSASGGRPERAEVRCSLLATR